MEQSGNVVYRADLGVCPDVQSIRGSTFDYILEGFTDEASVRWTLVGVTRDQILATTPNRGLMVYTFARPFTDNELDTLVQLWYDQRLGDDMNKV